jgi:hypothetical protein
VRGLGEVPEEAQGAGPAALGRIEPSAHALRDGLLELGPALARADEPMRELGGELLEPSGEDQRVGRLGGERAAPRQLLLELIELAETEAYVQTVSQAVGARERRQRIERDGSEDVDGDRAEQLAGVELVEGPLDERQRPAAPICSHQGTERLDRAGGVSSLDRVLDGLTHGDGTGATHRARSGPPRRAR